LVRNALLAFLENILMAISSEGERVIEDASAFAEFLDYFGVQQESFIFFE
jgi:hypothetical protein